MRRHLAALFLAFVDTLVCALIYALAAITSAHAKVDGVKPKAEFLIQMDYDINRDVDLDLWVVGPTRKPVFYASRQVGCAELDRDSLGFSTSMIALADGTKVRARAYTETTTLRCIEPGRWDIAVNRFSDHTIEVGGPIAAHVEVVGLNPAVRTVWAGDVILNAVGQTVNAVSFDLSADGNLKLVSVPLEEITKAYERMKAGGAP
jgi:hypothetical protein